MARTSKKETTGKSSALKIGGLAVALGAVTWFAVPYLFPVKVPGDFPALPDLKSSNSAMRAEIENADREARKKPASADIVGRLGMTYHANMFFDQAARAYRIAARLAPGDYQWAYGQAYLSEESGNDREQVKFLQQTLKLKPDYTPALMKLADANFKLDQLDQATHYYELAANGGVTLQATLGLGRIAARRQDWNKLVERIVPLTQSYSYVLQPYELLLEAYTALHQAEKASQARDGMAAAQWKIVPPPDDPFNEQLIAVCSSSTRLLKQAGVLSRVGQPDRAIQVARRAAQAEPADPEIRNFLARAILTFFGDQPAAVDEALTQLSECLRLRPSDLLPLWGFTDDFFKTPKPPAAVERLQALLQPHAGLPEAHYSMGLLAESKGNDGEAAAQFREAQRLKPDDSAPYNKLGQIHDRAGRFEEAVQQFRKAIQLNPMNNGARLNLGVALMQKSAYGQAVTELTELLKRNPHDAPAQFCMGYALMYSKRLDEAIAHFREGLRDKPDDADAHYGLASALAMQRKRDEALAEVRQALKLRADFPAARELLSQLGG